MAIRMTGLTSGLDTETIISQLVEAHKTQVDNETKNQTKLEWKKEAWSSLNNKLYSFYTGALSTFKSVGTYKAKKATSTNDSKVTLSATNSAVNGTHTVSIKQMASAGYLTGTKISGNTATTYAGVKDTSKKLSELTDATGNSIDLNGGSFKVQTGEGAAVEVSIATTEDSTIDSVIANLNQQLTEAGAKVTAGYDTKTGAFTFTNNTAEAVEKEGYVEISDEEADVVGATLYAKDNNGNYIEINDENKELYADAQKYQYTTYSSYEGGEDVKIFASDAVSSAKLGITQDGFTIAAQKDDLATSGETGTGSAAITSKVESKVTGSSKLTAMGIAAGTTYTITVGGVDKTITVDDKTTLDSFAKDVSKLGINASYDAKQGRLFFNSKGTGEVNDFSITSNDEPAMEKLGLADATRVAATDAIFVYNGATFKQASNTLEANGLVIEAKDVTVDEDGKDTPLKITVDTDTDTIYNSVKSFIKEYNSLISEMNTLYNAKRVTDYEPLTDDEKKDMSDEEVTKWENKIKDSLLRRDDTISSLLSTMRSTLNQGIAVTGADGNTKNYSLASFGINTGIYTEYGKLHLNGDPDDAGYKDQDDKLKAAIRENPDAVIQTLSGLGSALSTKFFTAMKKTELSSALTFYEDKGLDNEISDYKEKVKKLQTKLTAEEDRYYKQFSAMESAMSKLNSQQSYLSQLLG